MCTQSTHIHSHRHVRRSEAWSYWDRNSCYIGFRMACPSQQRVGRGNRVRSDEAADRQTSIRDPAELTSHRRSWLDPSFLSSAVLSHRLTMKWEMF